MIVRLDQKTRHAKRGMHEFQTSKTNKFYFPITVCKIVGIFCIAQVVIPVCAVSQQQHMWSSFPQTHSALSCLKMRFFIIIPIQYFHTSKGRLLHHIRFIIHA